MDETFIILTAEQARAAAGKTSPWTALDPVPLADGVTFVLPARVLTDPAHLSKRLALRVLSTRLVAPQEWPAPLEQVVM
jgi:hypothetical protein